MTQKPTIQDWQSLRAGSRIFFVGIGGISMSGLAEIAKAAGHLVAGSDKNPTYRTDYLKTQGIMVYAGHRPDWIDEFKPDLVVHTAAVHNDNPELIRARALQITTIDRATFLGWLNRSFRQIVNISGTHGKTTTTAICSLILMKSGINPTVHLGAELSQFHGTVHLGMPGQVMVSEACEYMNSFHQFYSTTAAVLNIDYDHVDCFGSLDAVIHAFAVFSDHLPDDGFLVVPSFDAHVAVMLQEVARMRAAAGRPEPRLVTFGDEAASGGAKPDFYCRNLIFEEGLPNFEIWHNNTFYCRVHLRIPGRHNVYNALAAVACACLNGADSASAEAVLDTFQGAEGRFTETGSYRGARVIADYAHHPSAARATLAAASHVPHQHTWVVFQPLTFSRTRVLFDDFVDALKPCELVIFSEIYSDRETNPGDISSRMLADRINELGGRAVFAENFQAIREQLDRVVRPGDLILVLGPENIREFADELTGRPPQAHCQEPAPMLA